MKIHKVALEIKGCGITSGHPTIIVKFSNDEFNTKQLLDEIKKYNCKRVEFTGVDPLKNQLGLLTIIKILHEEKYFIEVTTNGYIMPDMFLRNYVHLWNVMPKLKSTGLGGNDFYYDSLSHFAQNKVAGFIFIYSCKQDIEEIKDYVSAYQIPPERVTIITQSYNLQELISGMYKVSPHCFENGFVFGVDLNLLIDEKIRKKRSDCYGS